MSPDSLFDVPLNVLVAALKEEIFLDHVLPVHRKEFLFYLLKTLQIENREFNNGQLRELLDLLLQHRNDTVCDAVEVKEMV